MLEQGQQLHDTDIASGMRMFRPLDQTGSAPAQDTFVLPFLEQVAHDRSLVAGFAAVLSAALSEDSVYKPAAYCVPVAEFRAGMPGADGTERVDAEPAQDHLDIGPAHLDAGELDPSSRIAEALAVLFAAAREHGRAEVWGAHSLVKLAESTIASADAEDADSRT